MGLLPNMPYHLMPELEQYFDRAYNNIMAAMQWSMTQTNLAGSTIAAGMGEWGQIISIFDTTKLYI
jgi:hypothetical protein